MALPLPATAKNLTVAGLGRLPRPVLRRIAGAPVRIDGKTLDLEIQAMLRLQQLDGPGPETGTISRGRRMMRADARAVGGAQPIGAITERQIPGPEGPITLRFYTPRGLSGMAPALVFIHGGAFVFGDLDSHDAPCRVLAEEAQVRVIAVDYRLAPEHPFPAAPDDVWAAWTWINENAQGLGISRLAVGGDSAGGNLAAGVAIRAVREGGPAPHFQLLIYPTTDAVHHRPSKHTYGSGFYLTTEFMNKVPENYFVSEEDASDPLASPILADLTGVAPAHVVTAGFDPLLDEGRDYADALRAAGVPVDYACEESMIHGYLNWTGYGTSAPAAVSRIAQALQRGLST